MPTISDFKTMPPSPYDQPAIVGYNRLESSPVSSDYTKSLQASVHDALWLLTRQWQMGEFEAEDAGSALKAKVLADQRKLSQAFLGNSTIANNTPLGTIPLETLVEQELATSDLSMRIESGNLLKQVIMDNNPSDYWTFLSLFRLALLESNLVLIILDEIKREPQSLELFNAVKNKALDGYTAYFTLSRWTTEIDAPAILNRASAMKIKDEYCLQFETLYGKSANPTSNTPVAWQSQQMEYKFSIVNQNNDTALTVDQYANGSLDWYDFDISKIGAGVTPSTCTFMPTPVIFEGMPKPRWWEMEDSTVNFGDVNAKKTDSICDLLTPY